MPARARKALWTGNTACSAIETFIFCDGSAIAANLGVKPQPYHLRPHRTRHELYPTRRGERDIGPEECSSQRHRGKQTPKKNPESAELAEVAEKTKSLKSVRVFSLRPLRLCEKISSRHFRLACTSGR